MNEINVSIPYSLFKNIFEFAFSFRLIPNVSDEEAYLSIDIAKNTGFCLIAKRETI